MLPSECVVNNTFAGLRPVVPRPPHVPPPKPKPLAIIAVVEDRHKQAIQRSWNRLAGLGLHRCILTCLCGRDEDRQILEWAQTFGATGEAWAGYAAVYTERAASEVEQRFQTLNALLYARRIAKTAREGGD